MIPSRTMSYGMGVKISVLTFSRVNPARGPGMVRFVSERGHHCLVVVGVDQDSTAATIQADPDARATT